MAIKFNLPEAPVDQYEVRFWQARYDTYHHVRAVYHVGTPWFVYAALHDEGLGGVNINDDWMIYDRQDSKASSRICGWSNIRLLENDDKMNPCFETELEAIAHVTDNISRYVENLKSQVKDNKRKINKLESRYRELTET